MPTCLYCPEELTWKQEGQKPDGLPKYVPYDKTGKPHSHKGSGSGAPTKKLKFTVSYERVFNIGNYQSVRLAVEKEFYQGERAIQDALAELEQEIMLFHNARMKEKVPA